MYFLGYLTCSTLFHGYLRGAIFTLYVLKSVRAETTSHLYTPPLVFSTT